MLAVATAAIAACGGSGEDTATATPVLSPTATATPATVSPTATPSSTMPPTPAATPSPTATPPQPTPTPAPANLPIGFPIDPQTAVGWVQGAEGARQIDWGAGPPAGEYTRDYQAGANPVEANAGGWNCRVHVAFEGRPAVDWYLPTGTPVYATMDGTASLYVITTTNAFDYYGVSREPYIGLPSDAASVSPFPGPGGGKGAFVQIENDEFITESAHLELRRTAEVVPADAFQPGYSPGPGLVEAFAPMRSYLDSTLVARWHVHRGDLVGYTGDAGYSEAPHLHYTVRRPGGGLLCPTDEAGFADGGWLLR